MNKEKLIFEAIQKNAWACDSSTRPQCGKGQYDKAYEILGIVDKIIKTESESKTNFDVITESPEKLADFIDKNLNQDRDDWESVGCYNCINYGTHHSDKNSPFYECKDCEYVNGVLAWLNQKAEE